MSKVEDRRTEVPEWEWGRLFDPAPVSQSPFANSFIPPGAYNGKDLAKEPFVPSPLARDAGFADIDKVPLDALMKLLGISGLSEPTPIKETR